MYLNFTFSINPKAVLPPEKINPPKGFHISENNTEFLSETISDLIDGHVSSLNFQRDNKGFYEFNLGTGKGVSVFQILNTFQNIISKPIKYNIKSQRPGEIPSYYCDPAKAKKYLKWTSKCDIHSMCEDALLWYKKINNY